MRFLLRLALAGTTFAALASAAPAAEKAEVIHWWTSGGESAAANEFKKAFAAEGGEWVDAAVAGGGGEAAKTAGINRIIGGNPPTAMQFNISQQFYELIDQGLLKSLDDVAAKDGWGKAVNPVVLAAVTRNGHIYAAPVNIHSNVWLWYSPAALAKAGVNPPKTWDDFFKDADALKKAGIVPLAQGGDPWTQALTFFNVMLGAGGEDLYLKVFRDRDPAAVTSDDFRKVVEIFGRLRDYVDDGVQGRQWNQATGMVVNGQAGFNFMGDWAKGEMVAAGKVPGQDIGCIPGLGHNIYWIGGDVIVFPKSKKPDDAKAQDLLAHVLLEPSTQVAFNNKKGSVPVRSDVDTSSMDACAKAGVALLGSGNYVGGADMLASPDTIGSLYDLVAAFWADKNQTPDEFIKQFADVLANG